jgi:hypothetical protein
MKIIKYFFGFFIGFIISLIILETFVKNAQIEGTSTTDFDNILGRKKRGNYNFTFFNEGFSMGSFNKYSYLGPCYDYSKPKGTLRIAILGDSFVESFQLFRRNQFHSIIEENLSLILNKNVEVLNFGRSGFDLADMYAYKERFVNKFHADYVLFFLSNRDLLCKQTDPLIPKVVEENGQVFVTNEFIPKSYLSKYNKTKIFTQNSCIMAMINNSRKLIVAGKFFPKILDKFYPKSEIQNKHNITEIIHIPPIAYSITNNLEDNVIIVKIGKDKLPNEYMSLLKNNNLRYIDIRDTLNILENNGIETNYWPVTNTYGHWNHKAHQAIGSFLSKKLSQFFNEDKKNGTIP